MKLSEEVGDVFVIEGGRPLRGTVAPAGNKNEALPALAASLLAAGATELENVPRIGDVLTLCEVLASVGDEVSSTGGRFRLDAADVADRPPDPEACSRIRASFPTQLCRN